MPSPRHPALTYALRGIVAFEITLHGPNRDLHSGIFGGTVENPAMALCRLLAELRDKNGRITIPGFYDEVQPLSAYERKQFARLPFKESQYLKLVGAPKLFGERGYTVFEQRSARPTLEINGLTSGYQGEGSKTIIPAWARAKITTRLVPNQKPAKVIKSFHQYLPAHRSTRNQIRPRSRTISGLTHRSPGAGCPSRAQGGFSLRAGPDA